MDKQHILNEIRRTAKDGKAIGQKLFFTETGIRVHEWHGKYWAKWSDALLEAGFGENEWQIAFEESEIFKNIIGLIRKLGKYPTKAEMQLERRENQHFPSPHPLRRLGGKKQLIKKLIEFCETEGSCDDVLIILRETPVAEDSQEPAEDEGTKPQLGYVYLLASARKYKIGYSKAALSRTSVISNMSPEGGEIIHLIRTDDMRGIEAYWHNRFADKRGNGEWFTLSAADVAAFKRRKFM